MSSRRRFLIIAIALAGATLLAIAVQGGRWWTVDDVTIGPFASSRCFDGECKSVGLGWVPGASSAWLRTGTATYAAALCAALLLVVVGGSLAAKRVLRRLAASGLVAALTAAVTGGLFIALYPGIPDDAIDRGLWLYLGGVVLAVVANVLVLRARGPRPEARGPTP